MISRLLSIFVSLIALSIPIHLEAETEDAQFWNQYLAVGKIAPTSSPNSLLFLEFQPRVGGDFESLTLFIARGALGYQLTPNWSIWQGYGWVPVYSDTDGRRDEHRIFQQLLGVHKTEELTFVNRTRFEQRLLETPNDTSYRFRHLFRVNYQPASFGRFYLGAYDELFMNLNSVDSPALKSGIDQNRLFLGFGYNISKEINAELGYIHNVVRNQVRDRTNHVSFLGLRYNW